MLQLAGDMLAQNRRRNVHPCTGRWQRVRAILSRQFCRKEYTLSFAKVRKNNADTYGGFAKGIPRNL